MGSWLACGKRKIKDTGFSLTLDLLELNIYQADYLLMEFQLNSN
jgi:hypothetical protein